MSNINYSIETILTEDTRLNEIPLKVIVQNNSDKRIRILSLVPSIPTSAELDEVTDAFQEDSRNKFLNLCHELTFIIDNNLKLTSEEHRNKLIITVRKIYSDIFKDIWSMYHLFKPALFQSHLLMLKKELTGLKFIIENTEDAKWAYNNWIKDLPESNPDKKLYEGKLQQMTNLYQKIGENNSPYIAIIEPGSFYSRTYVLKFYRNKLSTKIYNVSFDSKYEEFDPQQELRANVSTSISITPKPLALTFFAAIMSVLGTILKFCMNNIDETNAYTFFNNLGNKIITATGITSIIIAILIFNIYEFTELGNRLKLTANWRAALAIGILSGLFGERIIEAIKVFVGFT